MVEEARGREQSDTNKFGGRVMRYASLHITGALLAIAVLTAPAHGCARADEWPGASRQAATAWHEAPSEQARFQIVRKIHRDQHLTRTSGSESKNYCEALLSAVTEEKNIKLMVPIVETDDYDDPALAPSQSAAIDLPPPDAGNTEVLRARGRGDLFHGAGGFKLYFLQDALGPEYEKQFLFGGASTGQT